MKYNTKRIVHLALAPILMATGARSQQCINGFVPKASNRVTIVGKQCPCLDVDARCFITDEDPLYADVKGKRCSALTVELDANGNYPEVELEYRWEMCNQNNFDIKFDEKAKFYDWDRKDRNSKRENIENPRFPLTGRLRSGECRSEVLREKFDTSTRYNVATQLEGAVYAADGSLKDESTDYCYAYAYENVNIKRGLCKVSTDAVCNVTPVGGVTQSCQSYIDMLSLEGVCKPFDASLAWKACNKESYDMKVITNASNIKYSGEKIGQVGNSIKKNSCTTYAITRKINNCSDEDDLYYSINLQGTREMANFGTNANHTVVKDYYSIQRPLQVCPANQVSPPVYLTSHLYLKRQHFLKDHPYHLLHPNRTPPACYMSRMNHMLRLFPSNLLCLVQMLQACLIGRLIHAVSLPNQAFPANQTCTGPFLLRQLQKEKEKGERGRQNLEKRKTSCQCTKRIASPSVSETPTPTSKGKGKAGGGGGGKSRRHTRGKLVHSWPWSNCSLSVN